LGLGDLGLLLAVCFNPIGFTDGLGFSDLCIAHNVGNLAATNGAEVVHIVGDALDF